MDEEYSEKENHAPSTGDVHSPPPLAINSKGNIFAKQGAFTTQYERQASSPNSARKRQKLGVLSNTPPRPSYASQMSKIFAPRHTTRRLDNEVTTPPGIPEDAMRVFNHFKQALKCRTSGERIAKPRGMEQDDSDSSSEDDAGHGSGQPLLQPNKDPSRSFPTDHEEAVPAPSSPPTQLFHPHPHSAEDLTPTSDLERAISAALPPTPSRQERRKTLNIDMKSHTPPSASSSSSTESWTGDEVFFPRDTHNFSPPDADTGLSPLRQHSYPSTPSPPAVPLLSPLRAIRSSRFHVPVVRSPMGQGVPLCMETHPESGGSDADDEGEGEGVEGMELEVEV